VDQLACDLFYLNFDVANDSALFFLTFFQAMLSIATVLYPVILALIAIAVFILLLIFNWLRKKLFSPDHLLSKIGKAAIVVVAAYMSVSIIFSIMVGAPTYTDMAQNHVCKRSVNL
jgi:amino acid transporter